jgi:hypothetical protein
MKPRIGLISIGIGRSSGFALCLMLGLMSLARADDGVPLGRFDLAPYRVMVRVTFAADPSVTPALRQNVVATLTERIAAAFGPTWTLLPAARPGVLEDSEITPPDEQYLERLTYASLAEKVSDSSCQKAYFLFIRPHESKWLIAGREWDRTVQRLGPLRTCTTSERRAIADAALGLLEQLFSPLLIVNDADRESKTATASVYAGSIPPGDPSAAPLRKGSLFLVYFRFLDSKGNIRKIQPLPWTYLVLDDLKDGRAKCAIASTYRAPLAANMRRRVEAIAILLRPNLAETRLRLVVGRTASRPLAGMFVDVAPLIPNQSAKTAGPQPRQEFLTDREGAVTIGADSRQPLRLLEVHSGSVLLARRPFVAGVDPDVTLELVDDEIRLNTQRDVDLLRIQLIETVARRAALVARTRASLKTSDAESTRQLLADLDRLPKADFYLAKLNEIRVVSLDEASRRRDAVTERRIEDLCQKTRDLIEQYLPEERLQTLHEEVATALAEAQAAADAVKEAARKKANPSRARASKPAPAASAKREQTKQPQPAAKPEPDDATEPAEEPAPENKPKPAPAAKKVENPQKPSSSGL